LKRTLAIICGIAAFGAAHAQYLYDSLYTDATHATFVAPSDTGSTPRFNKADSFVLANRGATPSYSITGVSFGIVNWATTTINYNVRANLALYDLCTDGTSGATSIFPNAALLSTTVTFNNVSLNTNTFTVGTVTFGAPVSWTAPDGTKGGFTLRLTHDNNNDGVFVEDNLLSSIVTISATYPGPYVGSSTDGYYRDADANGSFTGSDYRSFTGSRSDLGLVIIGTPVPEPASMAVLGIGALALIRRRRSRKA
jgi:hypothetical protein